MSDPEKSVLDIVGWAQELEAKITELQTQYNELKEKIESAEAWRELIVYRPSNKNTPVEISWTEEDDSEKQKYYKEHGLRRDVIGLVKKV